MNIITMKAIAGVTIAVVASSLMYDNFASSDSNEPAVNQLSNEIKVNKKTSKFPIESYAVKDHDAQYSANNSNLHTEEATNANTHHIPPQVKTFDEEKLAIALNGENLTEENASLILSDLIDRYAFSTDVPDEGVDAFFSQLAEMMKANDDVREAVKLAYQYFPANDSRRILTRLHLKYSAEGRQILLEEAERILEYGDTANYSEMLDTLAERKTPDEETTITALRMLDNVSGDSVQGQKETLSALNYIGQLNRVPGLHNKYKETLNRTLENTLISSQNKYVQEAVAHKLMFMNDIEQSTEYASTLLSTYPTDTMVNTTLIAIKNGKVALNDSLESQLTQLLNRPDVTDEELNLASTVF